MRKHTYVSFLVHVLVFLWQSGMAIGMQTPGMAFLGQPQFMGMRPAGPQYTADMQKQMAEEHQWDLSLLINEVPECYQITDNSVI